MSAARGWGWPAGTPPSTPACMHCPPHPLAPATHTHTLAIPPSPILPCPALPPCSGCPPPPPRCRGGGVCCGHWAGPDGRVRGACVRRHRHLLAAPAAGRHRRHLPLQLPGCAPAGAGWRGGGLQPGGLPHASPAHPHTAPLACPPPHELHSCRPTGLPPPASCSPALLPSPAHVPHLTPHPTPTPTPTPAAMIPLWMFPMATAAGNCMVLKPSERDPGAAMMLAELALEAGGCGRRGICSAAPLRAFAEKPSRLAGARPTVWIPLSAHERACPTWSPCLPLPSPGCPARRPAQGRAECGAWHPRHRQPHPGPPRHRRHLLCGLGWAGPVGWGGVHMAGWHRTGTATGQVLLLTGVCRGSWLHRWQVT